MVIPVDNTTDQLELVNFVDISMDVEEGNLTVSTTNVIGGKDTSFAFASEAAKGDQVILVTTVDKCVQKASTSATDLFGELITNPEWKGIPYPTASATSGNYTRRKATVRVNGQRLRKVPLEADNTAIAVGQSVKPGATTVGKWNLYHATNHNKTRAIQKADAASGAKIEIIDGYYGDYS